MGAKFLSDVDKAELMKLRLKFRESLRRAARLHETEEAEEVQSTGNAWRSSRERELLRDITLLKDKLSMEKKQLKKKSRRKEEKEAMRETWRQKERERHEQRLRLMEEEFSEREECLRAELRTRELVWEKEREKMLLMETNNQRKGEMLEERLKKLEELLKEMKSRTEEKKRENLTEKWKRFIKWIESVYDRVF